MFATSPQVVLAARAPDHLLALLGETQKYVPDRFKPYRIVHGHHQVAPVLESLCREHEVQIGQELAVSIDQAEAESSEGSCINFTRNRTFTKMVWKVGDESLNVVGGQIRTSAAHRARLARAGEMIEAILRRVSGSSTLSETL
jgi:FKBP-type peptidyl-prolyl cis-trans isomerase 2